MQQTILHSTPLVHTPGLIAWARNGAQIKKARPQMIEVLQTAFNLTPEQAVHLLDCPQSALSIDEDDATVGVLLPCH